MPPNKQQQAKKSRLSAKLLAAETRKRSRPAVTSSDEDSTQAVSGFRQDRGRLLMAKGNMQKAGTSRDGAIAKKVEKGSSDAIAVADLKKKLKKSENDRKKVEARLSSKKDALNELRENVQKHSKNLERAKKEKLKLKRANEKLEKDKQELETLGKRNKKKMDHYRTKLNEAEVVKVKLESKLSSLQIGEGSQQAGASGGGELFQDMMDNFRELAETQLQCAVCNELFVDAVSVNCGHTFCSYCIAEWRKKKNNCPVCRAKIKAVNPVKVLDEYADKVYEQFVSTGGKQARTSLKDERSKMKTEAEKDTDNSLDSDDTFEIRFNSDFSDSDEIIRFNPPFYSDDSNDTDVINVENSSGGSSSPNIRNRLLQMRNLLRVDSDSDSDDSDFSIRRYQQNRLGGLAHESRRPSSSSSSSSDSSDEEIRRRLAEYNATRSDISDSDSESD